MRVGGHLDINDGHQIAGWIFDYDNPRKPLELELMKGDEVVGRCTANTLRQDLVKAGIGDGRCGFHFLAPPFVPKSSGPQPLGVRVRGTSLYLQYAPPAQPVEASAPEAPSAPKPPKTLSKFGGLWIDREDWLDELALRHRLGTVSDSLCHSIFNFVRDGYLIIPNAVPEELVAAFAADVERLWDNPPAELLIETWEPDQKLKLITARKDYRLGVTKLLDVYAFSQLARDATAAPKVIEFLRAIFDDTPKAFQGLYFAKGSEQAIHKDTAYVKIDTSPMHLAATWLALEDVRPGTGELSYYVGSHRAPEYLFGGTSKWLESNAEESDRFLQSLHEDAAKFKQVKSSFLAKKGDVLIWHADLAHGGAKIEHPGSTRKSQVTHFTSAADEPYYRRSSQHRELVTKDCVFVSNYANVPN